MGTVTFSQIQNVSTGGRNRACIATVTMSNSYSTNGDSLNASVELPFTDVENIDFFELDSQSDHFFKFDRATKKILAYEVSGGGGGNTGATSGGTPSGTINAQSFSGNVLAGHAHNFAGNAMAGHAHTLAGNALAGHSHTFSGNASGTHTHQFVPQQIANKAVVANVANIDVVGLHPPIVQAVYANVGGVTGSCTILPPGAPIATGQVEYDWGTGNLTFFAGDAVTECNVSWLGVVTTSAGSIVPTGTIDSVSAGTPTGTIDSVSAGTPSGTVQQAVLSGDLLPTHVHSYVASGALIEVSNGADISNVSLRCKVWGRM